MMGNAIGAIGFVICGAIYCSKKGKFERWINFAALLAGMAFLHLAVYGRIPE